MATPLRVLILEDRPEDAELMLRELHRAGFDPDWRRVETGADYLAQLHEGLDVILSDYSMPQFDGLHALRLLQERGLDIPFIIVTGTLSEEAAVECMKQGMADYLLKDRLARLGSAVRHALQKKLLRDEIQQAEQVQQEEAEISAALARVGRELIASLDTPTILDRLCQLTTEVLRCEESTTVFWQPEKKAYIMAAGYGHTAERREILRALKVARETFAGLVARLNEQEVVEVEAGSSQNLIPEALLRQFGVTAVLFLALRRGKDLIGFQTAGCRGHSRFSPSQKRIAQSIAQLASLALENARLLEQAESASRLKSDFLATMSHELRTPLHIILGYTDLLLENDFGPLTEEQAHPLRRVDESAQQLLELITSTLDVSRLEAGRLPVEVTAVDVAELVTELKGETATLFEQSGLRSEWRVAPALSALRTDRTKLKVVLKNLLSNAVKFTDEGSVTVEVHPQGGGVEFCVRDTGIGMAPDVLPEIFEMFRQGDGSTTRLHGGAGLGLYIVQRLLELLRGTVAVESVVGQGSSFRVWVPLDLPAHL